MSDDIQRIFDDLGAIHITVQKSEGKFLVNYRLPDRGFTCAQGRHATIKDAIGEHLPVGAAGAAADDGLLDL